MSEKVTETLEYSRQLIKIYQKEGHSKLTELLNTFLQMITKECKGDIETLNARLITIISGILSVVYPNDNKTALKLQLKIMKNFIYEDNPNEKIKQFSTSLIEFFKHYSEENKSISFSRKILLYLKSCSLQELKMLTVASIAEEFGYNKNHLTVKFKKEQKTTVVNAIVEEKMDRAMILLKNKKNNFTVKEISHLIGFTDVAYFSKVFKKRFGILPSEVQKTDNSIL